MQTTKSPSVIVASIFGLCLIISSYLLASAIKDFGRKIERSAVHQPRATVIPANWTLTVQGGNSPLRIQSD